MRASLHLGCKSIIIISSSSGTVGLWEPSTARTSMIILPRLFRAVAGCVTPPWPTPRWPTPRWPIALSTFALVAGLVLVGTCRAGELAELPWGEARDVDNELLVGDGAKWRVVCFLGSECPLARLYAGRLSHLGEQFSAQGVTLIGVNSNPQDSVADVRQYIVDHNISFPIFKDVDQNWARRFGASRITEVFVLNAANQVCYQGRIDDQYEPGISRAAPNRHDLRDAIQALVAGDAAPQAKTQAVGCLITYARRADAAPESAATVTFASDVAPILNQHCVECHRAGEIGPFALTDYDEVVGWGEMMLEVIEQGRMPPWHADPRHGKFVGARRMPEADQQMLAAWVAQGMAAGNAEDLPPQPERIAAWQMPNPPEEEFAMRAAPFKVPAEGTVEYQYFVVDPQWEEDRWVRAAQVVPGNASVVHHAIVFVRAPDGSNEEGIGWLGGYVPGQRLTPFPPGHARRIPARSKLVFQMHYTPTGRETSDVTKVGVWFSDPADVTHEVTTRVALNHDFEIPPGAKEHAVEIRLTGFARESRLLSVTPHMHLRGKSFRLESQQDDQRETLLHVPRYDFNWQHWYHFEAPLELDEIAALQMHISFDNSRDNPTNPNPDEFVTWGDQTWQEMAVAFLDVAHPRDKPRVIVRHERNETAADEAEKERRTAQKVDHFLASMDHDGDGIVLREEAPEAFRRFGFRNVDTNRDGRLDRSEIEAAAAHRL